MATITKRGKCQWQAAVRRKGYEPQFRTFDTKGEAAEWARDVEAQMKRRTFADTSEMERTTLAEALARYGREITPTKKGALQEGKRITRWKREPVAAKFIANIRPADFAEYRDRRLDAGISGTTIRTDLALVSHLYTVARKEWSWPVGNPVADISLPSCAPGRTRRLEPLGDGMTEEAFLMLAVAESGSPWLQPMVKLALLTAARQGELRELRWADIDTRHATACFEETKAGGARQFHLLMTL